MDEALEIVRQKYGVAKTSALLTSIIMSAASFSNSSENLAVPADKQPKLPEKTTHEEESPVASLMELAGACELRVSEIRQQELALKENV